MSKTQRDRISKILIIVGILMIMCPIMIRVGNSIITARKISTFQKDVNEKHKEDKNDDTTIDDSLFDENTDTSEKGIAILKPDKSSKGDLKELYQKMKMYNLELNTKGQDVVDAFSYQDESVDLTEYGFKQNVIGVINIPKLKVKLPIYLGATTANMKKGAVHLTTTSLPLGEINSNVVIAAHRGMVRNKMFRHLDKLEEGDRVIITTMWDTLEYKVCKKEIIEPTDSSKILIQKGKDMVTLITCHPFRVNTHRYVVYCERV